MNSGPAIHPLLDRLLVQAHELGASDLHLVAGVPAAFRVTGEIILADADVLSPEVCDAMASSLLSEAQQHKFDRDWELCISVRHELAGRVRMTFYKRNGGAEMSCRFCGGRIPAREELGLPARVDELARKPNGLVLITGPTGAGKTTTLNYMVDLINAERRCKILTIEDPIEFVHENRRAIVVQQEVLTDVR
jgi:twitching motility protein PilT